MPAGTTRSRISCRAITAYGPSNPSAISPKTPTLGSIGGATVGVTVGIDTTSQIVLNSGAAGINYDFCVEPPGTISGFVFQDGPPITSAAGRDAHARSSGAVSHGRFPAGRQADGRSDALSRQRRWPIDSRRQPPADHGRDRRQRLLSIHRAESRATTRCSSNCPTRSPT